MWSQDSLEAGYGREVPENNAYVKYYGYLSFMLSVLYKRYFKTISTRLVIFVSLLMILAMSVFTSLIINKNVDHQLDSFKQEASFFARSLVVISRYPLRDMDYKMLHRLMSQAVMMPEIIEIQVTDAKGNRIIDLIQHQVDGVRTVKGRTAIKLPVEPVEVVTVTDSTLMLWKPIVLGKRLGWLKITQNTKSTSSITSAVWKESIPTIVLILSIAIILLLTYIRRPVLLLKQYALFADHLESCDSQQLQIDESTDEMKSLGSSLQRASKRLGEQNVAIYQAMSDLKSLAAFPANSPTIEISMNTSGDIKYINPAGQNILHDLNFSAEQIYVLMPADILGLIKRCVETQAAEDDVEVEANGHTFLWTFTPVADDELVHCYGKDITSIKQAEAQAHEAGLDKRMAEQANHAKSEFLANMSHEIRTPLTAIVGFSESLLDSDQSMSERHDSIQTIISSGKHLTCIINNILDLSKIEAGKIEIESIPFELFGMLDDVQRLAELQAQEKGVMFLMDYDFPLPDHIVGDSVRMKQILLNLCNNAIKFTEKGSVRVHVKYDKMLSRLSFDVRDTGVGLTSEQMSRLFVAFSQADSSTTRQYGGTGLGLHLSRQLAERMNGDIAVQSESGKGSCFSVNFKVELPDITLYVDNLDSIQTSDVKPVEQQTERYSGHILVAEDNFNNQQLVNLFLRKLGVHVTFANDGQVAVDLANENDYDLILMDMQMPVMDGLEATRQLMSSGCEIPIVALTANVMKEDREICRQAGCVDFLAKPINREQFNEVVARYLCPMEETLNPLYSLLLDEEPEMQDLVENFLAKLPFMFTEIQNACVNEKWARLSHLVHDMKSVGGGYGYPQLTEVSQRIELSLAKQNLMEVVGLVSELESVCKRVLLVSKSDLPQQQMA